MKARLNITIDDSLLSNIKVYAAKQQTSVSELVERYFLSVVKPARRKNIITLVEKLDSPLIYPNTDLKELFYQDQAKKYDF